MAQFLLGILHENEMFLNVKKCKTIKNNFKTLSILCLTVYVQYIFIVSKDNGSCTVGPGSDLSGWLYLCYMAQAALGALVRFLALYIIIPDAVYKNTLEKR